MILEAATAAIKARWLRALENDGDITDPTYGHLLVEGYLTKLQPFSNGFSRTRWFVLTTTQLLYFQEEAGQVMARCEAPNFENIVERGENCFVIHGKTPFSKSGADMVTCQCESRLVRDKWIQSFRQIRSFKTSGLTPLPSDIRPLDDHFGAVGYRNPNAYAEPSEGNRFIRNGDL